MKNSALNFHNLGGAFILLATGGVVAMATVVVELIYHSKKKLIKVKKNEKKRKKFTKNRKFQSKKDQVEDQVIQKSSNHNQPLMYERAICSCFPNHVKGSLCRSSLVSCPKSVPFHKLIRVSFRTCQLHQQPIL